jgi:hypothetical protein
MNADTVAYLCKKKKLSWIQGFKLNLILFRQSATALLSPNDHTEWPNPITCWPDHKIGGWSNPVRQPDFFSDPNFKWCKNQSIKVTQMKGELKMQHKIKSSAITKQEVDYFVHNWLVILNNIYHKFHFLMKWTASWVIHVWEFNHLQHDYIVSCKLMLLNDGLMIEFSICRQK